jgi:biotin operon repressor
MKELDAALKAVVDGLKSIAHGVEKLADKLEKSAPKMQAKFKAKAEKTAAKADKPATPKTKKAPAMKGAKANNSATAADTVMAVIRQSKNGVSTAVLAEKTGFDKKKLANAVFKLRKQGKIKSVSRGVYTKA